MGFRQTEASDSVPGNLSSKGTRLPWSRSHRFSPCWPRSRIRGGLKASCTAYRTSCCSPLWRLSLGANSYRTIHTFIDVHLARLREAFHLPWRRAPAYTTIRGIIQQVEADSIEQVFRRHAAILHEQTSPAKRCPVAIDGKVLRRSFDGFHDRKAAHILSAFATDAALVLAHADCDDKSNEIPAVQTLLSELGLAGALMTVDALHCQKNIRAGCRSRRSRHRPGQGQSAYPAPAHCRTVPAHGTSGSDPDSGSEAAIPR